MQNLAKMPLVLASDMSFSCGNWGPHMHKKNCEQGKEFVKFCCVKKASVGERGSLSARCMMSLGLR